MPGHVIVVVVITLATSGCGYTVGAPHDPTIRSVNVPIFTSDSFRRGFEFQLTEAVQREIETRTTLRLAKEGEADTQLIGHIVDIRKDVLGESSFDDPRELQFRLSVEVSWQDLRTGQVLSQHRIPISADVAQLSANTAFAPEVGQSLATATSTVVDDLADQIVDRMESPW